VYWLVLAAVLVSSVNAMMRYTFNMSSNAWLEAQWYLFAAVSCCAPAIPCCTRAHPHRRGLQPVFRRTRVWIDVFGTLVFLLPMALIIMWLSWPMFVHALSATRCQAMPAAAAAGRRGLLIPVGFFLLAARAYPKLIKRVAFLMVWSRPG